MIDDVSCRIEYNDAISTVEYLQNRLHAIENNNKWALKIGRYIDGPRRAFNRMKKDIYVRQSMCDLCRISEYGLNTFNNRDKKIIVSMTSYEPRLHYAYYAIASLLQQETRPDKVILWLANSLKKNNNASITSLEKLKQFGLEIRYCDDIKSHKKWYYAFNEYPRDLVITVDDDIIYDRDFISLLYKAYNEYKGDYVPVLRVHKIRFTSDLRVMPYIKWVYEYSAHRGTFSFRLFFTSGAGVVFQPEKIKKNMINTDEFMKLTPNADDIWLNAMCNLSGLRPIMADGNSQINGLIMHIPDSIGLWKYNNSGGFDEQMSNLLTKYDGITERETILKRMILDDVRCFDKEEVCIK